MYTRRIAVDPKVCFGKPVITGTRIPIHMILALIEQGLTPKEIITQCYPDLTVEDIKACVHYAVCVFKNEEVSLQEVS
ncbi:MAG: DUF433 domain-containing protein [Candidatus Omnitrophota bacterium]